MNSTDIYKGFQWMALLLMKPKCFDTFFVEYNFLDKPCLADTISKGLGIGIILGSVLVKFPQIIKIYKGQSGFGINLVSVTMDLIAMSVYASYNYMKSFPFNAWGDTAFLGVQTVTIGFLVLYYEDSFIKALAYALTYIAFFSVLVSGLIPVSILWSLQGFNIPLLMLGKLIQARTNYNNGHTGQLSAVTYFMLFFGSAARIFTSIHETGDIMVILTNVFSFIANAVIVSQILYYWDKKGKAKAE